MPQERWVIAYLEATSEHVGKVLRATAQHDAMRMHGLIAKVDREVRECRLVEVSLG